MVALQWQRSGAALRTLLLGMAVTLSGAAALQAQPTPPTDEALPQRDLTEEELAARRVEMDQKLQALLDEIEAFYKSGTDQGGHKVFTVLWEADGVESRLTVNVKKTGTYRFEPLYVVYAYTQVASVPDGQTLPPEVIEKACAASDELLVGGYSISAKRDIVFSNGSAFLNRMTAGELWMCLAQTHKNSVDLSKVITPLLSKDK